MNRSVVHWEKADADAANAAAEERKAANNWDARKVTITYTNWRGETARRQIVPDERGLRLAATEHHPEPQWVFDAWDLDRGDTRTFAMKDVSAWTPGWVE